MNDKPQSAQRKPSFSLKMLLPSTLLGRSLLILIVPVLLIQVVTTYVFFDRHWNKMTMRLAFAVAGEIFAGIVDDVIEAHVFHCFEFDATVNSGDLCIILFGDLYTVAANSSAGAINKDLLIRFYFSPVDQSLVGQHGCLRNGSCYVERHVCWFLCQ